MSRGWESKDVESQRLDAPGEPAGREDGRRAAVTPEERRREQQRRGLELSRTRVVQQLAETASPIRRQALASALAHLEAEIAKLTRE